MGVSGTEIPMGVPDVEVLMGVSNAKVLMGVALSLCDPGPSTLVPAQTSTSANVITSGSTSAVPALGFPLFLSNLQVLASPATLPLQMGVLIPYFYFDRLSWTWWLLN